MWFKKRDNTPTERILPKHIGIIMDGNGRWAKKRSLPRTAGHAAGSKNFKDIARYCNKIGLKYLTVYVFSTENWKRPPEEIENIMNILRDYLKDTDNYKHENIKLKFIGNIDVLPEDIIALIQKAEDDSKDATGLTVNMALNYGGRDEIVHSVQQLAKQVQSGELLPEDITEESIAKGLYTADQDEPDFIIRPSGEFRLSNFLVWQSAYAEFWYSDVLWPDFRPKHLEEAIAAFNDRNRRFGGI